MDVDAQNGVEKQPGKDKTKRVAQDNPKFAPMTEVEFTSQMVAEMGPLADRVPRELKSRYCNIMAAISRTILRAAEADNKPLEEHATRYLLYTNAVLLQKRGGGEEAGLEPQQRTRPSKRHSGKADSPSSTRA